MTAATINNRYLIPLRFFRPPSCYRGLTVLRSVVLYRIPPSTLDTAGRQTADDLLLEDRIDQNDWCDKGDTGCCSDAPVHTHAATGLELQNVHSSSDLLHRGDAHDGVRALLHDDDRSSNGHPHRGHDGGDDGACALLQAHGDALP